MTLSKDFLQMLLSLQMMHFMFFFIAEKGNVKALKDGGNICHFDVESSNEVAPYFKMNLNPDGTKTGFGGYLYILMYVVLQGIKFPVCEPHLIQFNSDTKKLVPSLVPKINFVVPQEEMLKRGMFGNDVYILQLTLMELGYMPQKLVSPGNFGPITESSLIEFQKSHKRNPTGVLDRETWGYLRSLSRYERVIHFQSNYNQLLPMSQGELVGKMQQKFQQIGLLNNYSPGYYCEFTRNAVSHFQSLSGLNPDGVYGYGTHNALMNQLQQIQQL